MKTVCLLSLSFVLSATVVAQADTSVVPISNLTFTYRTNLIDINQSQTFETLSVADEFTRLPSLAYKVAKVHFVVNNNNKLGFDYKEPNFKVNNVNLCKEQGFKKSGTCNTGEHPVQICPYDNKYFVQCCSDDYAYTKAECSFPRTPSSDSCGGLFKCSCDTTIYPYTNCEAPKEAYDKCIDDTGVHYAECRCPSYYKSCTGNNLQGIGTGCNRNGEVVYASCECKTAYKYVCEGFGPSDPNDYCLNGIKYYSSCKTCGDYGYMSSCRDGIECSFEQCSGKYFPTGQCSSDYTDISDESCDWYKYWMPCTVAPERT